MLPTYKMVDTCAAEFEAETPYFYSCHEREDETGCCGCEPERDSMRSRREPRKRKAIVIGSGPIRIGQGVEFDYCSVHSAWALREAGYESIIINNNPETVSTDFDTSDRLYFEPLTVEDVLNVIEYEQPDGVILQFGGQTAINLAKPLHAMGMPIFGSDFKSIDIAEDRDKFENILRELGIPKPAGRAVKGVEARCEVAKEIGYPGAGAAELRARRAGDGDRLHRGRADAVYEARGRYQPRPRCPDTGGQVRDGQGSRGGCDRGRRRLPDSGDNGAHRAGRGPLGRQHGRLPSADAFAGHHRPDHLPRDQARHGARGPRADEHPVRDRR